MVLRGQGAKARKQDLAGRNRRRREVIAEADAVEPLVGRMHNQTLSALVIEQRDPRSLHAPKLNVKKASDDQVARIGRAIEQLDFIQPVLITSEDEIIDGVSSVEAAVRLGLREIPVIVVSHLDAQGLSLLRIAVNALPQRAKWDVDNLRVAVTVLTS